MFGSLYGKYKMYDPGWRKSLRKVYMKTLSAKAMKLVNKVNSLMYVDMIRLSVWRVLGLEIEGLALILMIKYAMIAPCFSCYHGTMIIAAIILGLNFVSRMTAAIKDIPDSISLYKDLAEGYAKCLAEAEEKNQE